MGYHDSGGAGFLNAGGSYWFMSNPSNNTHAILGGSTNHNPYNGVSSTRLMFGGGDTNAQGNYYIGTNLENYGGNYTKLDLRWHTGIRMGAQPSYGGVRIFNNEDLGTKLFSVGETDTHVRVTNNLIVGGTLTVGGVEVGAGGSTHSATASGAIANGDPCVINTDGTISAVAETAVAQGATTPATFIPTSSRANTSVISVSYGGGKVLAVWRNASGYLAARAGTVNTSTNSIDWGTEQTLYSVSVFYPSIVYMEQEGCWALVYRDNSVSDKRTYCRGLRVDASNVITKFGNSWNTSNMSYHEGCYASFNNKAYYCTTQSNSLMILTVGITNSSNSSSISKTVVDQSGSHNYPGIAYDSYNEQVVYVYNDTTYSNSCWRTITLASNGGITVGSENVIFGNSYPINSNHKIRFDDAGNYLWILRNTSGNTIVQSGNVSGLAIGQNSDQTLESSNDYTRSQITYDSTLDNFALAYRSEDGDFYGRVITLGASSASWTSATLIDGDPVQLTGGDYLPTIGSHLFVYDDQVNLDGRYALFNGPSSETNLTVNNYIGIADAAYSNGATATVQLVGSVDDAQTSLSPASKYYVQTDGTLSTTAGTPSVYAGLAVSSTELIVKG